MMFPSCSIEATPLTPPPIPHVASASTTETEADLHKGQRRAEKQEPRTDDDGRGFILMVTMAPGADVEYTRGLIKLLAGVEGIDQIPRPVRE